MVVVVSWQGTNQRVPIVTQEKASTSFNYLLPRHDLGQQVVGGEEEKW